MSATCRFPMWPHRAAPTQVFCDKPTVSESRYPYCVEHRFICTIEPRRPEAEEDTPPAILPPDTQQPTAEG